jgi:hypothetical protein
MKPTPGRDFAIENGKSVKPALFATVAIMLSVCAHGHGDQGYRPQKKCP